MTLHTNVITRLAVLLLLLGVVMAIGTPQVSAHHPPPAPHYSGPSDNNRGIDITPPGQNAGHQPLRAAINRNLGRSPQTSIVYSDILSQRHMDLSDAGISYIYGLESMTQLRTLDLSGNSIADLSPLSGLTHLTSLNLSNNNITNVTDASVGPNNGITAILEPLDGLTALTHLDLSHNQLEDKTRINEQTNTQRIPDAENAVLYPLRGLTALQRLILSHNKIVRIDALSGLTNLTELGLDNNSISDFNSLVANTGLGAGDTVWVGYNPFGTSFFNNASYTVDSVSLISRGVTVYGSLGKVVSIPDQGLRTLLINWLTDVAIFQFGEDWFNSILREAASRDEAINRIDFARVRQSLQNEPLTESVLGEIRALNASSDTGEYVEILEGLQHCKNLGTLILDRQFLYPETLPIIGRLPKLKALSLSDTNIGPSDDGESGIKFLENLPTLTHLDLSNNLIEDISPLVKLTNLNALDLRHNLIEFLPEGLKNLNLGVLYLDDNLLEARRPLGADRADEFLPSRGYYDPRPSDLGLYFMPAILQELANRHPLISDMPIIKSVAFVEPEFAYGRGSLVHIKVTFNSDVGYKSSKGAFRNGRPYLTLSVGGNIPLDAEGNPFHTADYIEDGSEVYGLFEQVTEETEDGEYRRINDLLEKAGYIRDEHGNPVLLDVLDYFANLKNPLLPEAYVELGDTLEFGYFLPPGIPASSLRVESLSASPLIHFGPPVPVINKAPLMPLPPPSEQKAWRLGRAWFRFLTEPTKPVITTSPTVALRRADGETGTVTDDFDVEITFSGPLSNASAAALADHISFGDAAGVSIGSLTRPGRPTTYAPETWTLSVSVLGANGDVTVTLDPEGLTDTVTPSNPVATQGSTLSVTVPVSSPPLFTPKTEPYVLGQALEMSILFAEDGVMYEGDVPPYITIYLGERVQANERHAKWARAEDANSTLVTFAYEIGAGDVAQSVSIKSEAGVAVPEGATVVLGEERIVGTAPPPAESGVAPPPTQQPAVGGGADPGSTQRTVISLGTPSARVTATEIPVQIVGTVWFPETPTERETSGASSVPRTPIVFNELGNGSGDTNDWLEFRNVTGTAVSLKDWTLSVVQDDKKEDTSLIAFPDISVPANGLLLIVNTSPDKTPLARGANIAASGEKNGGSAQPYLVNAGLSLPDDGKFLLILRNAKDKLGKNEAFIDVAGGGGSDTDAFVRNQEGDYDTYVWPLQVGEAPGGNTEEALGSGKVWQRAKADIVGYHKDAWAEAAFTGLGYDRKVTQSAATAGTPGYPNGAVKTAASTPKGSVTFSEIMVDSGGGKLPQWIELYNNSKTEVLNLNRWELEIQNVDSEDLVGRPIVRLTLQEKFIQPNQTLLIVSGDARASSSARLPEDRVYNLFKLHEKNLRIKKPHDTFLSAEGFYLKLTDRDGATIDEVGNTDGNRRTNDAPYWALSMSREEGVRSSLIRRYTKGKSEAKDGMASGNWVLAANVKGFVADGEELHWGHAEDIGSPGYRKGGPLPVELSSFSVKRTEKGAVVLSWTTESEVDNAGFNLRRSAKRASGFTLINPVLIAGAGTTGERQTYTFTDTSAKPGIEYYYQIEEVSFDGKSVPLVTRLLPGPVSASNRALTTFGELKRQR